MAQNIIASDIWTLEELRLYWAKGSILPYNGKEYTVHAMSYGDYFLQPVGWKGGEWDGFAPCTLWLKKVEGEKDKYEVDKRFKIQIDSFLSSL